MNITQTSEIINLEDNNITNNNNENIIIENNTRNNRKWNLVPEFQKQYYLEHKKDIFYEGDEAMKLFVDIMTTIPNYEPFEYQLTLMNVIVEITIPIFYPDLWKEHKNRILKDYGYKKICSIISSSASRREGKSTTLIMAAVALLLSAVRKKGYRFGIGIVSINFEASKKVIRDVFNMLVSLGIDTDKTKYKVERNAKGIKVHFLDSNGKSMYYNEIIGYQTGEVSINLHFFFETWLIYIIYLLIII
jgi:hypothetical protein